MKTKLISVIQIVLFLILSVLIIPQQSQNNRPQSSETKKSTNNINHINLLSVNRLTLLIIIEKISLLTEKKILIERFSKKKKIILSEKRNPISPNQKIIFILINQAIHCGMESIGIWMNILLKFM
jgi:hypothetical protein